MTRITRRSLVRLLGLVSALGLASPLRAPAAEDAAPRDKGSDTWAADALTQSDAGIEVAHLWSKGRKFREERVIQMMPILTIVNGDTYYAIDALGARGVAITRSPKALADDAKAARPMDQQIQSMIRQGAEKIGTERIGGRTCVGYQITDKKGKQTVWITDDAVRIPVRAEVFDRTSGRSASTHFNWARDLPIPDAFFEPDPRIQLERLSYEDYRKRSQSGPVGPIPVLHGHLLHGED
jgi:outer membrane lipoprotein-sorting protein